MVTKPVSVRISAEGGAQVRAELLEVGAAGEQMGARISRGSRSGSAGLQNIGFQVQDFAVQVGAGTSASQALAQQLPQLLSGFGLLGIAIGTTVAIAIPLAKAFFDVGTEAKSLDQVIKDMDQSVRQLQQTTDNYSLTGLVELKERYGEINDEVLLLIERQRMLAADNAIGQATSAIDALQSQFGGLFSTESGDIADFLGIEQQTAQVNQFGDRVIALNPVIAEFQAAMAAVSSATTFEEQASAISNLLTLLDGTAAKGGELYDQLVQAEDAVRRMNVAGSGITGWLDAATGGAAGLAAQLFEAARAAFSIPSTFTPGTLDGGPDAARSAVQFGQASFNGQVLTPRPTGAGLATPVAPRSRGGGGGSRAQTDTLREAARIYESTRTEAEKYSAEVAKLDGLLSSGAITQDTYNRALDDLKGGLSDATSYARSLENSFESAFTSFVTGASSAKEAAAQLLGQLATLFAQSAFKQLIGGGGFFGAVGGFLAGGRAGGGPVQAGQSYMVGERGPERLFMTGNGYVVPNEALRGGGSGAGVSIVINAQGAQEGVAAQIRREIDRVIPEISRRSVATNLKARDRGYT